MLVINDNILRRDTIQLLNQINAQIEEVEKEAKQMGVQAHQLRDSANNWVMPPLLLAKTQVYGILVMLQVNKK